MAWFVIGSCLCFVICRDHVRDVADALIIKLDVPEIRLTCIDQDAEHLENGLLRLSLGKCAHGRLDEIKLLLQVVKADCGVDAIPVQHFILDEHGLVQTAVDVLLVQVIEKCLEQLTARELLGEVGYLRQAFHRENLIHELFHLSIFHFSTRIN